MTNPQPFYEIKVPKRETELVFRLVEISNEYEPEECMFEFNARKRCHEPPSDQCEFCGLWMCYSHFDYKQRIWIEDGSGWDGTSGFHTCPCKQCAKLPKEDLLKLRQVRLEINQ